VYPNCRACLAASHVKKFREVTPAGHTVITANTLNFKPIFERLFLEVVGGPPSLVRGALASLGHSRTPVKI